MFKDIETFLLITERYRSLLDAEIANTVSSPEELEDERRYLRTVLSR